MICPTCNSKVNSVKSVIIRGVICDGCEKCLGSSLQKGNDRNAKYYKQQSQQQFKRELTQPFAPREFIQAFGADKAREKGMSDAYIRKNSI